MRDELGFQTEMGLETGNSAPLKISAREALRSYLSEFPWDCFYTTTFAKPQKYAAGVLDLLRPIIPTLCRRGIGVAEQHISGMWHAHGLVYFGHQPGFTYTTDFDHATERLARYGWSNVSFVRSQSACAQYLSKYLLKDQGFEYELYGRSRNWRLEGGLTIPSKDDIINI